MGIDAENFLIELDDDIDMTELRFESSSPSQISPFDFNMLAHIPCLIFRVIAVSWQECGRYDTGEG